MTVQFNPGAAKLQVVKALKETLHLGLKEAKDFVDAREFTCSSDEYEKVKEELERAGASDFVDVTPPSCNN